MLTIEGQTANIPGFGKLALPDESREAVHARAKKTGEPCPLGTIASAGMGLPGSVDGQIAELLSRDTVLQRQALSDTYSTWLDGLTRDVAPAFRAAQDVSRNMDLKDEIREQRAMEKLAPALEAFPKVLDAGLEPLVRRVDKLTDAVSMALLPAEIEGYGILAREMRAAEVRRRFMETPEAQRPGLALDLAGRGALDALHALDDDPVTGILLDNNLRPRVRETALRAIGGGPLLTLWRDTIGHAEHAASYAGAIAAILGNAMPFRADFNISGPDKVTEAVKRAVKHAGLEPWKQ